MKKFLAALAAVGLLLGIGAAFAAAAPADHKPQDGGLCTAFFNGQKNGWEKNGTPPPFQDLITRADDADGNGTAGQVSDVFDYCDGMIGGNPDHGRYTCTPGNTSDMDPTNDTTTCSDNPAPGNSGH